MQADLKDFDTCVTCSSGSLPRREASDILQSAWTGIRFSTTSRIITSKGTLY